MVNTTLFSFLVAIFADKFISAQRFRQLMGWTFTMLWLSPCHQSSKGSLTYLCLG